MLLMVFPHLLAELCLTFLHLDNLLFGKERGELGIVGLFNFGKPRLGVGTHLVEGRIVGFGGVGTVGLHLSLGSLDVAEHLAELSVALLVKIEKFLLLLVVELELLGEILHFKLKYLLALAMAVAAAGEAAEAYKGD